MSYNAATEIEIAASPEQVREVFLDFPTWPQWHQTFFKSITPASKAKSSIEKGDTLNVTLAGMNFSPVVLENSPQKFQWRGSLPLLLNGDHYFKFEPSQRNPGQTTFKHGEDWSGVLAFVFGRYLGGEKQEQHFSAFNRDFKRRVESLNR